MTPPIAKSALESTCAALSLALVPAPAAAQSRQAAAPPRQSAQAEVGSVRLGGTLGIDFPQDYNTGFKITANGVYTLMNLGPGVYFDLAGHIGFIHNGCDQGPGISCSLNNFEIVPAARLRYAVSDQVSVYGDFGLGFALTSFSSEAGIVSSSSSSGGGLLRFAGGVLYKLNPQISLVGEPLGFNAYFGNDFSKFHYSIQVGALFRL